MITLLSAFRAELQCKRRVELYRKAVAFTMQRRAIHDVKVSPLRCKAVAFYSKCRCLYCLLAREARQLGRRMTVVKVLKYCQFSRQYFKNIFSIFLQQILQITRIALKCLFWQ